MASQRQQSDSIYFVDERAHVRGIVSGQLCPTTIAMSASTSFKTIAQGIGSLRLRLCGSAMQLQPPWARPMSLKPSGARKMSRFVYILAASGVVATSAGYCTRQTNTRMYLVQDAADVPSKTVSIQRTEEQHGTRL